MRIKPFAPWAIAVIVGLGVFTLCISQAERAGRMSELEACFPYLSTLVRTLRTIDEFYVDEVDMGKLLRHGTKRLASSLDARSTVVFTDEGHQPQADLGLNIMLKGGAFVVISCESNSPSAGSEIMPGDRIVAIDILGILIVGFCALLCIPTGRGWYIDIGIAWALQSFIATLALSKYLEGKGFDE